MKDAMYKPGDILFNDEAWVTGRVRCKIEILHELPPINKDDRFKYVCKITSLVYCKTEDPWYKIENEYDLHKDFTKANDEDLKKFA